MPATESIASRLVRKGHNSITCFGVCLGQPHSHLSKVFTIIDRVDIKANKVKIDIIKLKINITEIKTEIRLFREY